MEQALPASLRPLADTDGELALISRDNSEERTYHVTYGELTAPMIGAIQELDAADVAKDAQIKALQAEKAAADDRMSKLEARLVALESVTKPDAIKTSCTEQVDALEQKMIPVLDKQNQALIKLGQLYKSMSDALEQHVTFTGVLLAALDRLSEKVTGHKTGIPTPSFEELPEPGQPL